MGGAKRKKSVGTFLWHGIVRSCRVRVRVRVKEGEELRIEGQKMREDLWGYMPFFFCVVKTHIPPPTAQAGHWTDFFFWGGENGGNVKCIK